MNPADFEAERRRLTAIARRLLGSSEYADDVVQEAWLRLAATDGVQDLSAWLTTVTTRLCLDHLRRRKTRAAAEEQVRPVLTSDPESDALVAERVGDAMQVVLDTLAPAERAAFVLHDVFGYPFDEISLVLGRSSAAVRQIASRARRKVRGLPEPPAERVAREDGERVIDAFLDAAHGGDLATLLSLLAPDAVMRTDLVGQRLGAQPSYEGAAAVAARFDGARGAAAATIDGQRGAAWMVRGQVKVAFLFQVDAGRITQVELIADPDVLATMEAVPVAGGFSGRTQS